VFAVDVVVVSYNSRDRLRGCVEPLMNLKDVFVTVVDNASSDRSLDVVADLPVRTIPAGRNGGFAFGCNLGWRAGSAPYVLFLNPDARIDGQSIELLAAVLDEDHDSGAVGPKILEPDGSIAPSQRRFPRLRSTYSQAFFLHLAFPESTWADELVRGESHYTRRASPDWVSGACLMVRRSLLERLHGFDEEFFLYCEDKDLCQRIRDVGYDVIYEPAAVATHEGGASAPPEHVLPVLAASRVRYARKHRGSLPAFLERLGVAIGAMTRIVASGRRRAHARSFRAALSGLHERNT
jgi:N-acetylglucosaminyl-diphospho-decaprenol L-rhamnosyltransferase